MNAARCHFCGGEKEYRQACEKCAELVALCGKCCGKAIKSCGACGELKCFRCLRGVSADPAQHVTTSFRNCRAKTHSYTECAECRDACLAKLIVSGEERHCFICLQELKRRGILYFNEKLGCAGAHEAVFCAPCHQIFRRVDTGCPVCAPPPRNTRVCVVCMKREASGVSVLPMFCVEMSHKIPICMVCCGKMEKAVFPCRYCVNKEEQNVVFFRKYFDLNKRESLLACRLLSNKLRRDNLAVDPFCCPQCDELSASPFLLGPTPELEESGSEAFLYCAAVCGSGSRAVLSGGFDTADYRSSADCWLVRFQLDGRFREYSVQSLPALGRRRHAHSAFYRAEETRLYVLGGVCKEGLEKMEYLDSVESLELDLHNATEEDLDASSWTRCEFKLAKPRAHFSVHPHKGKLYLFGGVRGEGQALKSIEVVDFARGSSNELIFRNEQLLPALQPALAQLDSNRILLFGSGKEAAGGKALEFDFEASAVSLRGDKKYSVGGEPRVYLARAFDRLVAMSGTNFGKCISKSNLDRHLKFRILGENHTETPANSKLENWESGMLTYENQALFDYLCVEFGN